MRNFILLPLLSILPLLVLSETSQHYNFSECKGTSHPCSAHTIFNISYPFREPSMPDYCGLPGYNVTCKNKNTDSAMLVLEIDNKEYKVGDINYEEQTINLVNTDFLGDGCPLHLTNTTFNVSRFSYTAQDLNLTLHFNCSLDASSSTPNDVSPSSSMLSNQLISSCPPGSNLHDLTYYSLPEDGPSLLAELSSTCNSKALIPILDVYKKHRERRWIYFRGAIQHGFYLNWTSDCTRWCKGCEDTGGVCLRDWESPGKPKCGCNDGSITSDTCNSKGERKKTTIIIEAGARGAIGYIAPEVFSRNFGLVSSKSDVYSYGMVVLEIAGGRKNPNEGAENSSEKYFPHWIYAQLDQNGDLLSCGVSAESEEIARKMVLVGLWCIQTMPENRPSMSQVIEMMEGSVDDLKIPPKPYPSSSPFGSIVGTSSIRDICSIDCIDSSVHS